MWLDTREFTQWMKSRVEKLSDSVSRAVMLSAQGAVLLAKRTNRFKDRSGALRKSIRAVRTGKFTAKAVAGTDHAYYIENGNKPRNGNLIRPKKAKALRFVLNGQVVFRRFVRAAAPRPFMKDARDVSMPIFERYVHLAAKDAFE